MFLRGLRPIRSIFFALLSSLILLGLAQGDAAAKKNRDKARRRALKREMESPYKKWLKKEVPYIITSEELSTFKTLNTDEEREQFIETFWERRNPDPGSPENEFREEYYRRIAYANERFASGFPGWKSDRGRIYIMYGPADEVESHPAGGSYTRPVEEGGGSTQTYPWEKWRYRYIDGVGTNVELEFVDRSMTGEYRMAMSPHEKDALANVPGGGLTISEQMGLQTKSDRRMGLGGGMEPGRDYQYMRTSPFERLSLYAKIFRPPSVKFRDLQAIVSSRYSANLVPFQVRTDFVKITEETILTPITIQMKNRDLQFEENDGVMQARLSIYARLTTLSGRVAEVFEDAMQLDVPSRIFDKFADKKSVYQKALPLRPGRYRLSIVLKDENSENVGMLDLPVHVRRYDGESLASSSLILATHMSPVPTSRVGSGIFVIGATKVRPSVDRRFARGADMGIYMQVYNLGLDEGSGKASAEIEFNVLSRGNKILSFTENVPENYSSSRSQITVQKSMPLNQLEPGKYTLQMKITDKVKNQTLTPSENFEIY